MRGPEWNSSASTSKSGATAFTPSHLHTFAFDSEGQKRFELSPAGRFVVSVGGAIIYDGDDEIEAVLRYNLLHHKQS